ncbi:MBL fold metallo-hydrolase [Pseudomonas xanthosomatis]|uniref:MBL fold metallo-hydrolase n=1 Tax=Pseudomonas xanthosomatis TaxID=2842356 RepID=UPI001C3C5527|nr:MBL fold metallo-hydrolase [Pseudomonas xanthosomatis]QXH47817.1 MBL fold metallo-hydrolase [Pseudomonas xanthosomatis]
MRAVFIGHQTWLVEHGSTRILIDPLLCEDFGLVDEYRIEIYPPRTVDAAALSDVDLIFLSHEHSDHFDIQSLNLLPRSARFVVGATIVEPVKQCIRDLGFTLTQVNDTEPMRVGDVNLRFYPADPKTAFWESRVTQVHIEEAEQPNSGIFIAVDALVSEVFKTDIVEGRLVPPKLVIVSNNSRVSPPGAFQSLENWGKNASDSNRKVGPLGIGVLNAVLTSYMDDFPVQPENIALCGGGFIKRLGGFAAFPFSDQPTLSRLANRLSLDTNIVGLLPGEAFALASDPGSQVGIDWVQVDKVQHNLLIEELEHFIEAREAVEVVTSVRPDVQDAAAYEELLRRAQAELQRLAKSLMLFITGRKVVAMSHYKGHKLGPKRIAFSFISHALGRQDSYALNLISGQFEAETHHSLESLVARYPFGVCLPLVDFIGMVEGDLQIWDIVGVSVQSWFEGGIFDGLIPFFYSYYGENGSPELLAKIIERSMRNLEVCP